MSLEPSQTIVRTSETLATEIDGEIVLISIKDGRYFGLDSVGSEIWRRLANPKQVDVLCGELKDHFDGDPATIEQEARAFIDMLSDNDLVVAA